MYTLGGQASPFPVPSDNGALSRKAYGELADRLLSLEIEPGSFLTAVETARELGVSRTPAQGALRWLAEMGLLETRPRGFAVPLLTAESLHEPFQLRVTLEALAVDLAVRNAPKDHLDYLLKLALVKTLTEGIRPEMSINRKVHLLAKTQDWFHSTLAHISGNAKLTQMVRLLILQTHRAAVFHGLSKLNFQAAPNASPQHPDHKQIAEAMFKRQRVKAIDLMEAHLESVYRETVEVMTAKPLVPYEADKRKILT